MNWSIYILVQNLVLKSLINTNLSMQFHNTIKQTSQENKQIHQQVDIVKLSNLTLKQMNRNWWEHLTSTIWKTDFKSRKDWTLTFTPQGIPSWLANLSSLCFFAPFIYLARGFRFLHVPWQNYKVSCDLNRFMNSKRKASFMKTQESLES